MLAPAPRAAFSRPLPQFFTIRTSQPANNIYIFNALLTSEHKEALVCLLHTLDAVTLNGEKNRKTINNNEPNYP